MSRKRKSVSLGQQGASAIAAGHTEGQVEIGNRLNGQCRHVYRRKTVVGGKIKFQHDKCDENTGKGEIYCRKHLNKKHREDRRETEASLKTGIEEILSTLGHRPPDDYVLTEKQKSFVNQQCTEANKESGSGSLAAKLAKVYEQCKLTHSSMHDDNSDLLMKEIEKMWGQEMFRMMYQALTKGVGSSASGRASGASGSTSGSTSGSKSANGASGSKSASGAKCTSGASGASGAKCTSNSNSICRSDNTGTSENFESEKEKEKEKEETQGEFTWFE